MLYYHSDADGVIKLVHEDADDGRGQQQQDERVFELCVGEGGGRVSHRHCNHLLHDVSQRHRPSGIDSWCVQVFCYDGMRTV